MMTHSGAHRRLPELRPLVGGLVLALAGLSTAQVTARELHNDTHEVVFGDDSEVWHLTERAHLRVNGGSTQTIGAYGGSTISLDNARVEPGLINTVSVQLRSDSVLRADNSHIEGGGVRLRDRSTVDLRATTISMGEDTQDQIETMGIFMVNSHSETKVSLDDSRIHVVARDDQPHYATGIGIRQNAGSVVLRNGSQIDAGNVGVMLYGTADQSSLLVDNSTIISRRGAAIEVFDSNNAYDVRIANGASLTGGDGHLLRVHNPANGPGRQPHVTFTVDNARLEGDIALDPSAAGGRIDLTLQNQARITGRFANVTSAAVGTGSRWSMTSNSSVGHLQLDADGTVALGNGSTFNTLSVDSFVGNGGTLLFNTALGDDGSATDTLVVNGNASGQAGVRVHNANGAGAKTDQGIALITVGGASDAHFDLIGRAVGGQYEYFLVKDVDGNWYLRSLPTSVPEPCDVDPGLPQCGPGDPIDPVDPVDPVDPIDPVDPVDPGAPGPVLRPEAGAYLANQFTLHHVLRHTWRDRDGRSGSKAHAWSSIDNTHSRLGAVQDQLALKVDRSRLQIGTDIGRFDADRGRVGVMLTAATSRATSRSTLTGYSARGKVEGGAAGAYASWSTDALYLDASVQRGRFGHRVEGDGLTVERHDTDLLQSAVEAGYSFGIGTLGTMAMRLQPRLQLVHTAASSVHHREANGTVVRSIGGSGLSGRVGLRLAGDTVSGSGPALRPYLAADWYRDGDQGGVAFDDEVLAASTPHNRYALDAGASVAWRTGLVTSAGIRHMRGEGGFRQTDVQLDLAYRW